MNLWKFGKNNDWKEKLNVLKKREKNYKSKMTKSNKKMQRLKKKTPMQSLNPY